MEGYFHEVGPQEVFMATGVVKRFDEKKGFGFIVANDAPDKDIFVHYSDVVGEGFKTLAQGDEVEFDLIESPKGLKAVNVRKISE